MCMIPRRKRVINSIYIQDSFTGTNGTNLTAHSPEIGGSWVLLLGTWQIQSNAAKLTADGGGTQQNAVVNDASHADGTVWATVQQPSGSMDAGIICNAADANNYWLLQFGSDAHWNLYEHNAGGFASRASGTFTLPGVGSTFIPKMVKSGDSISVYFDGTLKTTYTVVPLPLKTNTKCGLRTYQSLAAIFLDFTQTP